jgi:hypothetical protein
MKTLAGLLCVALLAGCSTGPSQAPAAVPGHGAIELRIEPNPIVAHRVSGETYDFPFEVVVRETGGHAVQIKSVTATVRGPGGFALGSESWDAERIRSMNYATTVNASSELRYRFAPRKSVPDDRLFGSVSAELRVDAVDDTNKPLNASTTVTITR